MTQDNREKYAYLDRLSTRRLEELLLADAEDTSERDTSEVILHILEVLQEREDDPSMEPVDTDRAWKEFQQYYNTPEGEGKSLYPCGGDTQDRQGKIAPIAKKSKVHVSALWKTVRVAAAAVALVFALMVGAQASGLNVFGALAQWTSETFRFGAEQSEIQSENYQMFLDILAQNDIQKELVPTWYPSGFVASEPVVEIGDSIISVGISFFNSSQKAFHISIDRYTSQPNLEKNLFEKDDIGVEPYLSHGKTFYIFANLDSATATWTEGALLETIWGDLSEDDIKSIIDSIGGS